MKKILTFILVLLTIDANASDWSHEFDLGGGKKIFRTPTEIEFLYYKREYTLQGALELTHINRKFPFTLEMKKNWFDKSKLPVLFRVSSKTNLDELRAAIIASFGAIVSDSAMEPAADDYCEHEMIFPFDE